LKTSAKSIEIKLLNIHVNTPQSKPRKKGEVKPRPIMQRGVVS
jgi:hypothetical protein